jgi:hypothetical protein
MEQSSGIKINQSYFFCSLLDKSINEVRSKNYETICLEEHVFFQRWRGRVLFKLIFGGIMSLLSAIAESVMDMRAAFAQITTLEPDWLDVVFVDHCNIRFSSR